MPCNDFRATIPDPGPSTGWRCPGCSACYAPSVTECQRCAPVSVPSVWLDMVPNDHPPIITITRSASAPPWTFTDVRGAILDGIARVGIVTGVQ
jgi:hypothetical protein